MRRSSLLLGLAFILSACGSPPEPSGGGPGKVAAVTDATFDRDVLLSKTPVMVDFWSPSCGPCLAVAPVIEEIAADFEGKVKVVKLKVDDNDATVDRYRVTAYPTFILFKEGVEVQRQRGTPPPEQARSFFTVWLRRAL